MMWQLTQKVSVLVVSIIKPDANTVIMVKTMPTVTPNHQPFLLDFCGAAAGLI
jgi:hypothetical protein